MSKTTYTGTILTDVAAIVSGPYACFFGRLTIRARGDRFSERGRIELDPEFRFVEDASHADVGDVHHVGLTAGARTIRSVTVGLSEYRRLTEAEMIARYAD